jgi:hypothetical protein
MSETLEKARKFLPLYLGQDFGPATPAAVAAFADEVSAELRAENQRLREELTEEERISALLREENFRSWEALEKLDRACACLCQHDDEDCCARVGEPCATCLRWAAQNPKVLAQEKAK